MSRRGTRTRLRLTASEFDTLQLPAGHSTLRCQERVLNAQALDLQATLRGVIGSVTPETDVSTADKIVQIIGTVPPGG